MRRYLQRSETSSRSGLTTVRRRNTKSAGPVPSPITDTRELVEQLFRHLGDGDAHAAAALFSERVDFALPHDPAVW